MPELHHATEIVTALQAIEMLRASTPTVRRRAEDQRDQTLNGDTPIGTGETSGRVKPLRDCPTDRSAAVRAR
jgi:hypothetical protein